MRLGMLVGAVFASLVVGCSGGADVGGTSRLHGGGSTPAAPEETTTAAPAPVDTTPKSACPAGLPQAVSITAEPVADMRIVAGNVYFRSSDHVSRVPKTGGSATVLYTSKKLTRAFVDADGILATESEPGSDPVATFKIIPLGAGATARDVTTTYDPSASFVFGSDASAYYAVGDGDKPEIVAISKTSADPPKVLATIDGTVRFPQVNGTSIWFVRDDKKVMRVPVDGATPPAEVFSTPSSTGCALAVGDTFAYCSLGTSIEQRNLGGLAAKTLLEADKSKLPGTLGASISLGDSIFVRSTSPTIASTYGDVLRAVAATGEEKLIACGRDNIHDVTVDATTVAWAEGQAGAFVASR